MVKKNEPIEVLNFGVTVKVNDETKGSQMTGVWPSASHETLEGVVKAVVEYLNEKLGTKMIAVPVYVTNDEDLEHRCGECGEGLQLVRPGKYQCVNCEVQKESVK